MSDKQIKGKLVTKTRFRRTRLIAYFAVAYLLLACLLAPIVWMEFEDRNSEVDNYPQVTRTSDGHPGDPINVSLIADEATLIEVLKSAGWFRADALPTTTTWALRFGQTIRASGFDSRLTRQLA